MLRPQTWYLALAVVLAAVAAMAAKETVVMTVVMVAAALTALGSIFLYDKRRVQATATLLPMVLLLAWYVLLAVENHAAAGSLHLSWTHALPLLALLLVFMARRGIVHDEKVVRAYDRIR